MDRLFRALGHFCGIGGAVTGIAAISRMASLSFMRVFPATSILGHSRVTGPLSLWLLGLGLLLVRFRQGR